MSIIELPLPPLEGELNVNCIVAAKPRENILLQRNPKQNRLIMESIAHEYHFMGFTDQGGRFRRRTSQEQVKFIKNAAAHGLRVLSPVLEEGRATYYPYLKHITTLDNYLPFSSNEDLLRTTYELFDDLRRAHKQDIIYGDRWSKNILVIPNFGILNIDFDIEISGKPAKEFEVAQAAYYTLCAGKDRTIPLLAGILSNGKGWFNFDLVEQFLQGHAAHFLHTNYGGIENETSTLIELVRKKISSN